jgi:hypothetical protein
MSARAAAKVAGGGGPGRVALVADLPKTDATSLGVQLPTHQAVHAAASALIIDDYLNVTFHSAADILRRALSKAGVSPSAAASDSGLGEPMLRIIRDVLIPSLPLLTLARTLFQSEIPLRLVGDWPNLDLPMGGPRVVIESLGAFSVLRDRWADTAAVVHLSPWGTFSPIALDAAAAGVPVIAPRHPSDAFAGSLPMVLGPALERPQANQLVATIKSVVRKKAPAGVAPPKT